MQPSFLTKVDDSDAAAARRVTLRLAPSKGWRRRGGHIELQSSGITFTRAGVLREPLTLNGQIIEAAAVHHGGSSEIEHGRFEILRRLSPTTVIPREEGNEGWLWTSRSGSALPELYEADDAAPNLALLFTVPLAANLIAHYFEPRWVEELAESSPHGEPVIPGLLATVADVLATERAFTDFGALKPITDREVPPAVRRHLPGDKPANPRIVPAAVDPRAQTSFAPPGMR